MFCLICEAIGLKLLSHSAHQRALSHLICVEPTNLMFEIVETQSWPRTVRQRIPSRRARNIKAPTTKTVQTISIDCSIKP